VSELIVDNKIQTNHIGSGIDFDVYKEVDAINQSFLSKMYNSPAKAMYSLSHPDEETDAMVFGRLIHGMVLEPEQYFDPTWFYTQYCVLPSGIRKDPRTKAYQSFIEGNEHKTLIKSKDLDNANAMANAIKLRVGPLSSGRAEVNMFYKGKHFDFKARVDYLSEDGCIIDLKTTRSAHPGAFKESIDTYNYDLQAAFYCYLYNRLTGKEIKEYKILAVEKEPPFISEMYTLSPECLKTGMEKLMVAIKDYNQYINSDAYSVPGYRQEELRV